MTNLRRIRAIALLGTAAGGTLVGHVLAYVATIPHDPQRAEFLRHSGHGYLPGAAALAALAALAAMWATVVVGFRRGRGFASSETGRPWTTALQLWAMQSTGFVVLEVIERAAGGHGMSDLSVRLLLFGVVSQGLVALAAAVVLSGVGRVAEAAARAVSSVPRPRRSIRVRFGVGPEPAARFWLLDVRAPRAPPVSNRS